MNDCSSSLFYILLSIWFTLKEFSGNYSALVTKLDLPVDMSVDGYIQRLIPELRRTFTKKLPKTLKQGISEAYSTQEALKSGKNSLFIANVIFILC